MTNSERLELAERVRKAIESKSLDHALLKERDEIERFLNVKADELPINVLVDCHVAVASDDMMELHHIGYGVRR